MKESFEGTALKNWCSGNMPFNFAKILQNIAGDVKSPVDGHIFLGQNILWPLPP